MPDFSAQSKFDASKNYTEVKFGADAPLLEVELNELQQIQNNARAELVRQSIHSGFTSLATIGYLTTANQIKLNEESVAFVNGYEIKIPAGTVITLPAPPTFGTRDDLVFLEAWFEEIDSTKDTAIKDSRIGQETSRRIKLNWRIRTVAGVDFNTLVNDGFTRSDQWWDTSKSPTAQGGNSSPLVFDNFKDHAIQLFRGADFKVSGFEFLYFSDDKGLFVAGKGDQASKDLLKTADGYVYAIPLFRVKRRNSGGYREDNLNGALNIDVVNNEFTVSENTIPETGGIYTVTVNPTANYPNAYDLIRVGQAYSDNGINTDDWAFRVLEKLGNNKIKVQKLRYANYPLNWATWKLNLNYGYADFYILSGKHPEAKFANIIDKDDIIDLRHQVSLTGFNYQKLLEENFDKLLRGELQTKGKPVMKKERFNLVPAPQGLKQELVPVTVVGNDGVARNLKNEIGKMIDLDAFKAESGSVTAKYVENNTAIEVTSSNNFTKYYRTFIPKPNAYYLFVTESYMIGDSGSYTMYARKNDLNNSNIIVASPPLSHTSYAYKYIKFQAPSDAEVINVHLEPNANNPTYRFRGFAVYEIDQNTYNLIDVDPEFTGDKLSQKFPCVDSYPNFAENLLPNVDGWEFGNINVVNGYLDPFKNIRTKNYVPVIEGKTLYFSTKSSAHRITAYFYDGSYNFISAVFGNATILNVTTVPTGAKYAKFVVWRDDGTQLTESEVFPVFNTTKPMASYFCLDVYVPQGRWFLPHDYASRQVPTNFTRINDHRGVVSDAQISMVKTDIVEALKTPQSHIKVTQATEGQWSVGDTIQITSQEGVITGVLDADTASAKVMQSGNNTTVIYVDDVSKFSMNDKVRYWNLTTGVLGSADLTITAIDTVNKTITVDIAQNPNVDDLITETTPSTSAPVVTATGIAGTWSGLGTKQATFTITTPPTNNTDPIKIDYSISYPAGQGISEVPMEVYEASVNGERLVKASDNIVRVKANFEGKVILNTDLIPHKYYHVFNINTLQTLNGTWYEMVHQVEYDQILKLDGTVKTTTSFTNGGISQQRFSFDLIRLMEDKFGEGFFADCVTTADKVNKLKSVITNITCNWWGYGSGVGGNKATLRVYEPAINDWHSYTGVYHTNGTVTRIGYSVHDTSSLKQKDAIDSNGFIHFLAYAEPSDGTTASTIYTDYVELEVWLNVAETGYDVLVPENPFPKLSDNLFTMKQALPVDTSEVFTVRASAVFEVKDGKNAIKVTGDNSTFDNFVLINLINLKPGETYTWSVDIYVDSDTYVNLSRVYMQEKGGAYRTFGILGSGRTLLKGGKWTRLSGTFTIPSDVIKPCTVILRPSSDSNDTWLSTPPVWYANFCLVNYPTSKLDWKPGRKKKTVFNFIGKVAGSAFENKNKLYNKFDTTFGAPSTFANEQSQTAYDNIGKQDGVLNTLTTNGTGQYAQELYEFDLSVLGLSLSELKKALRKLTVTWVGYGKGDNSGVVGYGATVKVWNFESSSWNTSGSNATNTPSTVTGNMTDMSIEPNRRIGKDQKVYVLVHSTYPAGTASASELYTDYIKLEVELADYVDYVKSNVVKVRKETKEVKLQYPAKSHRSGILDAVELWYKYVPYQGLVPSDVGYAVISGRMLTHLMLAVTSEGTGYPKKSLMYDGQSPVYSNKSAPVSRFLPLRDPKYLYDLCYHDIRNGEQQPTTFRFLNKAKFQENGVDDVFYPYNPYPTAGQKVSEFSKVSPVGKFYIHREGGSEGIYKGNIGKTDNYANFLAIGYGLFEYNGELYIGVVTTMNYGSKDIWIDSHWEATLSAADFYKIEGRPLVKGV